MEKYIKDLIDLGKSEEDAKVWIEELKGSMFEKAQTITVDYTDGDSYGTDNVLDRLDVIWLNPEIVKENLRRLEEHLQWTKNVSNCGWNRYRNSDIDEINKKASESDWYVEGDMKEHCIKLLLDNGNIWQIYTAWTGYFASNVSFESRPIIDKD